MLAFFRRNPQFKKLWASQVVSSTGDWLNRIATLTVIDRLGGSNAAIGVGVAYGLEYLLRTLPTSIFGSLAGPLADRLPRRLLMVLADVLRAAVVLCFLFVDEPGELGLLYGLIFCQMSLGIFFDAARSGALPNTVAKADLHTAYAISAATFSTMLSIGGFLGGLLVKTVGTTPVFLLDAGTYVLSALLLVGLRLPPTPRQPERLRVRDVVLFTDLVRGFKHTRALGIWPILFSKVLWSPCGGFLVLFPLLARRFEGGASLEETSHLIGLYFAARGLGTGVGPLVAKRLFGSHRADLIRQTWGGMLLGAVGYLALIFAPDLWTSLACVFVAHIGGSAQWVGSTTYWQQAIDDAYRGRVFACEFALMTLAFAVFAMTSGAVYDASESLNLTIGLLVALTFLNSMLAKRWFRTLPTS